jgi:hypothetical protein
MSRASNAAFLGKQREILGKCMDIAWKTVKILLEINWNSSNDFPNSLTMKSSMKSRRKPSRLENSSLDGYQENSCLFADSNSTFHYQSKAQSFARVSARSMQFSGRGFVEEENLVNHKI